MEVGLNFFPDVRPEEKAADVYFDECLQLVAQADALGFLHVRIVEHYFERYGGYSPNPITFLSAASQRSSRIKLITGAVLPAFNHPLKLAGGVGMLDGIRKGAETSWKNSSKPKRAVFTFSPHPPHGRGQRKTPVRRSGSRLSQLRRVL